MSALSKVNLLLGAQAGLTGSTVVILPEVLELLMRYQAKVWLLVSLWCISIPVGLTGLDCVCQSRNC